MRFIQLLTIVLSAVPGFGAINLLNWSATPTTLVLEYVAPTQAACTMEVADMNLPMRISSGTWSGGVVTLEFNHLQIARKVNDRVYIDSNGPSQWNGWQTITAVGASGTSFSFASATSGTATSGTVGYLVHDVNTSLFAGANTDLTHFGMLSNGRNRTLTIGKEVAEQGLDGKYYSRALQADSRHIVTLTCGSDVQDFDLRTNNIPLGNGGMVMPPRAHPNPLDINMPSFDLRCLAELPSNVAYNPVIDPASGILHTNGQVCGEYIEDRDLAVSPSNATVPSSTGWSNPDNILSNTDSGAGASTSTPGSVLCVRPTLMLMLNQTNNYPTYGMDNSSVDSMQLLLTGASSTGTSNVELNLSYDGCTTAWFSNWQTISLTSTPSNYSFPTLGGGAYPKGAFADWDPTQANPPTRVASLSLRNNNGWADGTTTFRLPANGEGENIGFFHPWNVGAPIIIGGTFPTYRGCPTSGAGAGTVYTITAYVSPKEVTLNATVPAGTDIYWCIPQPAWMIRSKAGTGTVTIDYLNAHMFSSKTMEPDSGGGRNRGSASAVLDYYNNPGHLIQFDPNGMYWISDDNGESRRVGSMNMPADAGGLWKSGSCGMAGNSALKSDSSIFLCNMRAVSDDHVVPVLWTIHWDGPSRWTTQLVQNAPWTLCTTASPASPNPCVTGASLIDGSGYTLSDLLVNFDPTFDPVKFTHSCGLGEPIGDVAEIACLAGNQDSLGWLGVLDMTKPISSYNPSIPSTNPVIALLGPSTVGMMMNTLHSHALVSENNMYIGQKPGRIPESNAWYAADGPFRTTPIADLDNTYTSCPSNYHGYTKCSTVQVKTEMFDPDPWGASTGTPGEYGTYSIDGVLQLFSCMSYGSYPWSCVNMKAGQATSDTEFVRVLAKAGAPPLITYTVARDVTNLGIKNWQTYDTCGITTITAGGPGSNVVTCGRNHGLYTGAPVTISGSFGMTGATGTFLVLRLSPTTFSLLGTTVTGTFMGSATLAAPLPGCWVKSITTGNPTTIGCFNATGMTTGDTITFVGISGITGGINATHTVTVTGPKTFTIPISTSGTPTLTQVCAISDLRYNQNGNILGYTCPTNPGVAAGAGVIVNGLSAQGAPDGSGYIVAICDDNCNGSGFAETRGWLMDSLSNGTPWTSGGTLSIIGTGYLPVRAMLMTTHLAESDTNPPDAPGVWQFRQSPHGTTNSSITTPITSRYYGYTGYGMSHIGCNPLGGQGGCAGLGDLGFMAYYPYTGAQLMAQYPTLYSTNTYALFIGKPALSTPNTTEIYISTGDVDCGSMPWCRQSLNSSPTPYHIPGNGETAVFEKVAGTSYTYRMQTYARIGDGVRWPYFTWKAQWFAGFQGYKPFMNVSGPSTILTDTLADVGKMCFAMKDGQCRAGSKAYEMYVIADQVNKIYADDQYNYCSPIGAKDNLTICIYAWHWLSNMGGRYSWGLNPTMRLGMDYQSVSHSFMHGNAGGYAQVPKIYPTGKWFGPLVEIFGPDRIRTKTFYAKAPIIPNYDNINRLSWIPYPVPIKAPAGTSYAQVEYGYDTFSDFANGKYYCGDFASNCIAGASTLVKPYDALDSIPAGVNLMGDYYVVSALSPLTIHFPSGHKTAAGTKMTAGACGNVLAVIVDSTHLSLTQWDGTPLVSNCGYNIGDQVSMGWYRQDSPYMWASESCTITNVTNTNPPEATCAENHNWQTGNTVYISGVGAGINGVWPITVTGLSTFQLVGAPASGTFSSGTAVPGGVACTSNCTITIPALSQRRMRFRVAYRDSNWRLISYSTPRLVVTP